MGKLGFIGLGHQGAPIAMRMIDAGLDVVLWARRAETLAPFADTPAHIADTVTALGEQVGYCGICVVDDAGVQQVCDELLPAMASGGRIVIHATIKPDLCKTLAVQAKARGLSLLDAPVSGGGGSAATGSLTVMVGGEAQDVEAIRPILATFAGLIVHLGGVGTGQMAKLVNNNLMAANLALAHHAIQMADTLGIDRDAFIKLVGVSSGRSFSFDVRTRMSAPTDFKHGARLLAKDVQLLGETLGNDPDYRSIRDIARTFLHLALAE